MKLDIKWLIRNSILSFVLFAVYLFSSICIVLIASDLFLIIEDKTVEFTYITFLVTLVVRIILEQKKDAKGDPEHFKGIIMHYAVLNVITYLIFAVILYLILRNKALDFYTRYNQRVIVYDFIYLHLTKSRMLAAILDYFSVAIVISGSNLVAYKWFTRKKI